MWLRLWLALLLVLPVIAGHAQPPLQQGKPGIEGDKARRGPPAQGEAERAVETLVTAALDAQQARRIASNHGYSGFEPLPPGIRKRLQRGKPLPPGIARQRRLPVEFRRDLPHYEGYEWRRLGTDLVLVRVASRVVTDILHDVFD